MSLSELNDAAARSGGQWVKLAQRGDVLQGAILDFENRPKTFEGQPVLSRKSGEQRYEFVFTLQTEDTEGPEDDGVRKVALNEAAQRAVLKAIKDAGVDAENGGHLLIAVVEDPPNDKAQAVYRAKYTPPAKKIAVPTEGAGDTDLDDLFG